jgi:multiple sugar transport system ATP-binding protein
MSQIEFRHICKRYDKASAVTIHNANLTIERGEFCVFVGPSGCGKSTLLRMVAGLEDISSGDLLIEGERVNDLPPARRGVAMVFQSYALYPHMTVRENMAFGLQVLRANTAEIDRKVRHAADVLQLTHLLDRLPRELSGGQRQRVAIGRAIVKEPRVFLFDEPLSNLDAALRVQTRLEIARLHQDLGSASMIYVTHDQVEAMTLADKIVLLRAGPDVGRLGSIAQIGTPMDLYHRPASRFVAEFIGSPRMNVLRGQLLSRDGTQARVQVGGVVFDARVDARHLAPDAPVDLGIRPEHLALAPPAEPNTFSATVRHVERLGDSSLVYLASALSDALLTLRLEGSARHREGDMLSVQAKAHDLHAFDCEGTSCPRTTPTPQ